ncbi:glycosyltransferase 87 family protein [Actinomadura kijaniata]|uniref:Alpha-1,2-mannosyltransferase n=1 Tax=Actinomadura namibiensis TaxID=182080 RepID=A0A7W3QKE4_ACTNM|nr:glycosyltransferase 87 family protein [Actinomadura namibiensis]MBA8950321.1 alpha-1,2-mannosyltransferase [Actinomadura namibiensis]
MRAGKRAAGGAPADRGRRTPPELLIVLLGVAVAALAVSPIVTKWLTNPPDQRMVDLEVYRDGGRAILRGAPLYEVVTPPPQLLPFTYPPFAAVLAVPFTLMRWWHAQIAWIAVSYTGLAVVVWFCFRDLIRRTGRWAPVTTGALFGAMAYVWSSFDQIRFGQVGFLLMALCLADCLARTAYWPRGALVGLAVAIKLVPGVFLVYFLLTGRRDALANAVLTAAAASLAAFALLPHDSADYWFGALLEGGERTGAVDGTTNQALNGMVARALPEGPPRSLVWLALSLVVAFVGFRLARRATRLGDTAAARVTAPFGGTDLTRAADPAAGTPARDLLLAGVAITGLLSVLLSPVGWIHHLVWMIAVIGALVGDGRDARRCLVGGVVWVAFLFPLPWWGVTPAREAPVLIWRFLGQLLRDAFGLIAVMMILVLGIWLVNRLRRKVDHEETSLGGAEVGTLAP